MDWLRSEDVKEEKNVTAPNSHYSSPCTLSFRRDGWAYLSLLPSQCLGQGQG
jgi:hypothetical protein